MKDHFKTAIENYLNKRAEEDSLFADTLKKENKNIDDCLKYILSQVKDSGRQAFEDHEIYELAVHYYDEDDLKVPANIKAQVVVGGVIELTEEDKALAKQKAFDELVAAEREKLKRRNLKKPAENVPLPTLF